MKGWVFRLLILRASVSEKSAITTLENFPLHLPSCCREAGWVSPGCPWQLLPAVRAEQCRDPGQDRDMLSSLYPTHQPAASTASSQRSEPEPKSKSI